LFSVDMISFRHFITLFYYTTSLLITVAVLFGIGINNFQL